jgi:hypothetical protein
MNKQNQNNHPGEDQPEGTAPPTPGDQPSATPPVRKFKFTWEFFVGFLGWYLATAIFYGQVRDQEALMICGGLLFPVNVLVLILLFKWQRQMGWGMLAALAVNMVVSLVLGLIQNAFCFIPFFGGAK